MWPLGYINDRGPADGSARISRGGAYWCDVEVLMGTSYHYLRIGYRHAASPGDERCGDSRVDRHIGVRLPRTRKASERRLRSGAVREPA